MTERQSDRVEGRGRRWFIAGAIVMLVFGAVHLLAVYQANFMPPDDLESAEIMEKAKAYTTPLGPLRPSAWGMIQILNASFSVLLLYTGVMSLAVVRAVIATGRLRRVAVVNAALCGVLAGVCGLWQFPPPMVFAVGAMVCFGVAGVRANGKAQMSK